MALCCMSHSPLLNLPGPSAELLDDIGSALGTARDFVRDFDPELVVIFSPDHYNGFFYRLMPPFCIGTAATGVGDYGTYAGPLNVAADVATACAQALWDADVDVSISSSMDVDHGTVQPLEALFGAATAVPVIPIFINSVATPLGPLKRVRALGAAVGQFMTTVGKRVLIVGSGGLSHDPPVPTLATAPPAALGRIVHGEPMSTEQRAARQSAVMAAANDFAHGQSPLRPLNPDWDAALLQLLDGNRIAEVDSWTPERMAAEAGNSAHEVRTWIAAFSAMAAAGPYQTEFRYYRAAPELIAGFAMRTAVSTR
jgi:2,3-dihydroxyphenylpropionate 1,2-dioxygenase